MGCKLAPSVHTIEETKQDSGYGDEFWKLLGGKTDYPGKVVNLVEKWFIFLTPLTLF